MKVLLPVQGTTQMVICTVWTKTENFLTSVWATFQRATNTFRAQHDGTELRRPFRNLGNVSRKISRPVYDNSLKRQLFNVKICQVSGTSRTMVFRLPSDVFLYQNNFLSKMWVFPTCLSVSMEFLNSNLRIARIFSKST